MFGESESESPRAGSPWDPFLSTSPAASVHKHVAYNIPRLSPEVEEGNVEYKLKLLNPSPERFARLVTQLKWRLLEGGGQAYYELGVSDSGQLVGLSRVHLEQSLQTLEEMAGEIGASVIVVKEIEVPAVLLDLMDVGHGKTLGVVRRAPQRNVNVSELTESESATDGDADEDLDFFGPSMSDDATAYASSDLCVFVATEPQTRSHPGRPAFQTSPALLPFDGGADADVETELLPIDLEIASVYKPRPSRKRAAALTSRAKSHANAMDGLQHMPMTTQKKPWKLPTNASTGAKKRDTREERRAKAKAKIASTTTSQLSASANCINIEREISTLLPALEGLHVSVNSEPPQLPVPPLITTADSTDSEKSEISAERLIVEALVVRKMSLEEAFLDFGGAFTLGS